MKKKSIIIVVAVVLLCGIFLVRADDTSSPFYVLGEKLDAVYEAVVSSSSTAPIVDGYYESLEVTGLTSGTYFTVPEGKEFVLRKWARNYIAILLAVNDSVLIGSKDFSSTFVIDFPDQCVVISEGDTLKFECPPYEKMRSTVVGYFRDAQ